MSFATTSEFHRRSQEAEAGVWESCAEDQAGLSPQISPKEHLGLGCPFETLTKKTDKRVEGPVESELSLRSKAFEILFAFSNRKNMVEQTTTLIRGDPYGFQAGERRRPVLALPPSSWNSTFSRYWRHKTESLSSKPLEASTRNHAKRISSPWRWETDRRRTTG